jgi:hypothetical protein
MEVHHDFVRVSAEKQQMLVRDLSTLLSLSGESLEVSTNYRCAWHLNVVLSQWSRAPSRRFVI